MSSRFMSGGTLPGDSTEASTTSTIPGSSLPSSTPAQQQQSQPTSKNQSEWEAVQQCLEAERRQREQARKSTFEHGEQSLYDVLQANKAAKQAAFEEVNKIKNQFRALHDDEIDFLDTIRDEMKHEEERIKRETDERLAQFKKAQQTAGANPVVEEESAELQVGTEWSSSAAGRKRKREKGEKVIKGLKRRSSSGVKNNAINSTGIEAKESANKPEQTGSQSPPKAEVVAKPASAKPKLGLVEYGSDDDD